MVEFFKKLDRIFLKEKIMTSHLALQQFELLNFSKPTKVLVRKYNKDANFIKKTSTL